MSAREVLARVDLERLLTELSGAPAGRGRGARWHCFDPDHADDNPSVTMFRDRSGTERWRCWSGDHAGTAIDAIMIAKRLDLASAIAELETRSGSTTPTPPPAPKHRPVAGMSRRASQWVAASERRLRTTAGSPALQWLHDRGIDDYTIRANRLGYSPAVDPNINNYGIPTREAVTIPSFDQDGELTYVQARNLAPTAPHKYDNLTPGHGSVPPVVFPRGGPSTGPLIVTEGVLDGLIVVAAGFRPASLISVAAAAEHSAATTAQLLQQAAAGELIVLALDNDAAGQTATSHLKTHLPADQTRVLRLPIGHDLTSTRQQGSSCNTTHSTSLTASVS